MDLVSVYNLDFIIVGVAVAGMCVLGFTAFLSDPQSATTRAFFFFTLAGAIWSVLNYIFFHVHDTSVAFTIIRLVIFVGVWFVLSLFQFLYAFPRANASYPWWYSYLIVPSSAAVALMALTPFVFKSVTGIASDGTISRIDNGAGIFIYALFILGLVFGGLWLFIQKRQKATKEDRPMFSPVLWGLFITFLCIMVFNLVMPAFFNNASLIPMGVLAVLPMVIGAAYSIRVHHLFNVKVFSTAALICSLAMATLIEATIATSTIDLILRGVVFVLTLAIGVLLIRGVIREVRLREEVEQLSQQKSEFMSFASHEIRNPITAMRGYASLIADGTAGQASPEVKEIGKKILVEGNEVLALISQFLSKSKLELGQLAYAHDPFDVGEIVSQVVDGYQPHADEAGLYLKKNIELSKEFKMLGDRSKVREVVGNLIDNSLKYTKKGGVTVSVEKIGQNVRIEVADTGVGIPEDTIQHLFKKFSRADAQKMNLMGTGLGLYLGKTFIEAQGGRIWAESEGEGKGSKFIIEFPAA